MPRQLTVTLFLALSFTGFSGEASAEKPQLAGYAIGDSFKSEDLKRDPVLGDYGKPVDIAGVQGVVRVGLCGSTIDKLDFLVMYTSEASKADSDKGSHYIPDADLRRTALYSLNKIENGLLASGWSPSMKKAR